MPLEVNPMVNIALESRTSTANGKSELKVENFPNLGNKQIKQFKKKLIGEHNQKKKKFP